jgi:FkbM family methyltransferase
MLSRIIRTIKKRCANGKSRIYKIGQYTITLPPNHMLDIHQQSFGNYDKKLPVLASFIESKYSSMTIIDIGANIGDSAVALRNACKAPIICIEGNQKFLPLLKVNIMNLPGTIRIVPKFIGPESIESMGRIVTDNGTAHIERKVDRDQLGHQLDKISVTTYKEVSIANADLPEVRLIKTDTDGFDFKIILSLINQIKSSLPVLFFEFDPSFSPKDEKFEAFDAIDELIKVGYLHYVIYDNFGNYMFSFSDAASERFKDLVCFLEQSRICGGGVVYLDVSCFAEKDVDLFRQLVDVERSGKSVASLAA